LTSKALLHRYRSVCIGGILFVAVVLWGSTIYANLSTRSARYDLANVAAEQVPKRNVAIVFGAGVYADGTPTPYLQWRIKTAVKLYQAGRIHTILMTGDNSSDHYNEPQAMARYAQSLGVPRAAIVLDYAGLSTYDSCYRAKAIFKVHQATLVTQGYHLPRAVMVCRGAGINSIGVAAEHVRKDWTVAYIVREWLSTNKSAFQYVFKPTPTVLGKSEPIQ
jgi:vancomycin permeability regulator SanA